MESVIRNLGTLRTCAYIRNVNSWLRNVCGGYTQLNLDHCLIQKGLFYWKWGSLGQYLALDRLRWIPPRQCLFNRRKTFGLYVVGNTDVGRYIRSWAALSAPEKNINQVTYQCLICDGKRERSQWTEKLMSTFTERPVTYLYRWIVFKVKQ